MKIIEVKDGFIKIESDKKAVISSFLLINDSGKRYVAQIILTKRTDFGYIVYAKILFLYDGTFLKYDNTTPSRKSDISDFPLDIASKFFETADSVNVGKYLGSDIDMLLDRKMFKSELMVISDNVSNTNILINNFQKQFKKTVVIDMLGTYAGEKYIAAKDFKLPLNAESLEFMYEDCLNDATSDSKNLVREIFSDLAEYAKTVKFLPFETLKTIVDDMVEKSHIFKLIVLKNKLNKFNNLGYFAASSQEVSSLDNILDNSNVNIDLSSLDPLFQNRYLQIIYKKLSLLAGGVQVFVIASNALNKKTLKNIVTNQNVPAVFVTNSKFKYINEIKSMYKNFIVEPSIGINRIFQSHSAFLNATGRDNILIVGDATNNVPLISPVTELKTEYVTIEIPTEEEIVSGDYSEVSLADEFASSEVEQTYEENAIERKSDELVEKLAEETENEPATEEFELFSAEEESAVDQQDAALKEEMTLEQPEVMLDYNQPEEIHVEAEIVNNDDDFSTQSEFHTTVDATQLLEIPQDISDTAEEIENFDVTIEPEESTEDVALLDSGEEIIEDISLDQSEIIEQPLAEQVETQSIEDYPAAEPVLPEGNPSDALLEIMDEPDALSDNSLKESTNLKDLNIVDEEDDLDFGEVVELDENDESSADIIVDLGDETLQDDLDKEIVEDVDKVYTTIKDDSISDEDLDFIDELNSGDEETPILVENPAAADELQEIPEAESIEEIQPDNDDQILEEIQTSDDGEEYLAPLEEINDSANNTVEEPEKEILQTKNSSTPMVPIYDADIPQEDTVQSDPIDQGDTVVHAKYGTGVVEKMIKYGSKNLYSINFDNVGRRLLDPTLTEIKKA